MPTATEVLSEASWTQDQLDSLCPPAPEPPYFDSTLDAWVFSRYADVAAALRHPSLSPAPLNRNKPPATCSQEETRRIRAETAAALPPYLLNTWKIQLLQHADSLLSGLSPDQPFDLMAAYARPLCLPLAAIVAGLPQQDSVGLCEKARAVSDATADPYNQELKQVAKTASSDIERHFHSGPAALRNSGFIGLSQTLPAMLGNIWFALLQNPREWQSLHRSPERIDQAMEELVRYVGFTRILTRRSIADLTINGTSIPDDTHVILRLTPANRDPEYFDDPHRINLARQGATHLSFGLGPHSCVGAGLLRMASATATLSLVSRFSAAHLIGPVDWLGGAIFRYPTALRVHLHHQPHPSATPNT